VSVDRVAEIAASISLASGEAFRVARQFEVGGGCINRGLGLHSADGRRYFVKLNQAARLEMFAAEFDGLAELHAAAAIRVPLPLTYGEVPGHSFLVMEWLDLERVAGQVQARLGEQLARLHATTWQGFGWRRDNTIGATPQHNPLTPDWVTFFREQRLHPQLQWAARNGASAKLLDGGQRLLDRLAGLFPGYTPQPSLLHGDLWGGNVGCCAGQPVVFDPAVYYGDRETDLAMTELFGGFSAAFHAAYAAVWPLDPGYATRKHLYQLYHLLNHFNLFGESYDRQSEGVIERLLAEIG